MHRARTTICCRCFARITLLILVAVGLANGADSALAQGLPQAMRWSVPGMGPPSGAPVVVGSTIVVPLQGGAISAHDLRDGAEKWKKELAPEQPLAGDAQRVYVIAGEAIHALHATTGEVAWRAALGGSATAAPLVHAGWIIVAAANEVLAVRATDGEIIWRRAAGPVAFRPAIDGELLVVPVVDGHVLALDVQTGTERWKAPLGSEPTEPRAIGGRVYVGTHDKHFHALDAGSGRIEWTWFVGARVVGRAAVDERCVYFTALDNVLWALDRGHGAIKWKKGLTYRPAAGPVLLANRILVPGPVDALPAFSPRTGELASGIAFPARLVQLPLLAQRDDGEAFAVGVTGNLEIKWTLSLYGPLHVPQVPLLPLSQLPGEVILPDR